MKRNKPDAAAADKPKPLPPLTERKHREAGVDEALVDEAVAETMPASDPISPYSHEASKPVDLKKDERPTGGKDTEPPAKWQGWKRGE
jgi:hypothetical protein